MVVDFFFQVYYLILHLHVPHDCLRVVSALFHRVLGWSLAIRSITQSMVNRKNIRGGAVNV
jgi:hypothetical protein